MKKFFYSAICGFTLISCGGGESVQTNQTTDSTRADTVAAIESNVTIDLPGLMNKFSVTGTLPFVQDTLYLKELGMSDSNQLTAEQVRFLGYNFIESDLSYGAQSRIDDVLFFDSLRVNEHYESYVEVLDIGMMEYSDAYTAEKIRLDDSTELLLWFVNYATYEACPYASGRTLYASVFRNNQVRSCTLIGEDSGGADAPYWSETLICCAVEKTGITATKRDRNGGDTDEEGNDLVSESTVLFSLEIVNGNWQVTELVEAMGD